MVPLATLEMIKKIDKILSNANDKTYKTAFKEVLKEDWKHLIGSKIIPKSSNNYTRIGILNNDQYELVIVSWCPKQSSAIHNHNDQCCYFTSLIGNFEERQYRHDKNLTLVKTTAINPLEPRYIDSKDVYHSMHNKTNQLAVTLHLYFKPLTMCKIVGENNNLANGLIENDFEWSQLSDAI